MDEPTNSVIDLFSITTLRDLKRHCSKAVVKKTDLAEFIMALSTNSNLRLQHFRYHQTFVPDHLHLTATDMSALATNGVGKMSLAAQKTANKIHATFEERRMLSGHMFLGLGHWHFLYFDNRDVEDRGNHWIAGSHIHLISWLTTKRECAEIWQEFTEGNPRMKGALHIRFDERT